MTVLLLYVENWIILIELFLCLVDYLTLVNFYMYDLIFINSFW